MFTPQDISIVIATRNRIRQLHDTLHKLTSVHTSSPVIVVDNGSGDGTADIIRRHFPNIRVLALNENRGTGARTLGAQLASTPLVAFNDDDSLFEQQAFSKAAAIFNCCPRLGLAAVRVLVGDDEQLDPVCREMQQSPLPVTFKKIAVDNKGIPVLGFLACGSIVRKDAFLEVFGFEERFGIGGEEQLLAIDLVAAGWDVLYFDEITAYHYPLLSTDRDNREQVMIRNDLWAAWLRRPLPVALAKTLQVLRHAFYTPASRRAFTEALQGIRWILKKRRRVPQFVEEGLRLLENMGYTRSANVHKEHHRFAEDG